MTLLPQKDFYIFAQQPSVDVCKDKIAEE